MQVGAKVGGVVMAHPDGVDEEESPPALVEDEREVEVLAAGGAEVRAESPCRQEGVAAIGCRVGRQGIHLLSQGPLLPSGDLVVHEPRH